MRRNLFTRLFIVSACLAVLPVMLFTIISVYLQEKGMAPFGLKLFFMVCIFSLIIFSFIISYIFASKTEKPLRGLVKAAEKFSEGEFGYRVPDADVEDFQMVNNAINKMAEDIQILTKKIGDSEKMAALGRLISGLAHEINNPLAIISGYVQLASNASLSDEVKLREACGKINDAAERIRKIMKILMDFAGVDNAPLHPVSINEALKNTISILQSEIESSSISVVTEFDTSEPSIMAREDIIRAFYNITVNAIEAMTSSDERILTVKSRTDNDNVIITFSDTGVGVSQKLIGKLIEPFFTTKEFGRLGMGLSTAYSIIKNYDGDIDFVTNNGLSVIISLKRYEG